MKQECAATPWCGKMCHAAFTSGMGEWKSMAWDARVTTCGVYIHGTLGMTLKRRVWPYVMIDQTKCSTATWHAENTYSSTWTITLKCSVMIIILSPIWANLHQQNCMAVKPSVITILWSSLMPVILLRPESWLSRLHQPSLLPLSQVWSVCSSWPGLWRPSSMHWGGRWRSQEMLSKIHWQQDCKTICNI